MRGRFLPVALLPWLVAGTMPATAQPREQPTANAGEATVAIDGGTPAGTAELLARARVELARPMPSDLTDGPHRLERQARLARVEKWLRQGIALAPRDFGANFMLADVMLRQGRTADAVAAFERACLLARVPGEVFPCSLRLADARARNGQYESALAEYDRHLELGNRARTPDLFVRRAELMMAMGKLADAENAFATAVGLVGRSTAPREQTAATLARALFGQAVVLDRSGRDKEARQTMWRAIAVDPSLSVLEPDVGPAVDGADGVANLPFLPAGEVDYYRGLAQLVLGQAGPALEAFNRFVVGDRQSRWRTRAEEHLLALAAAGADLPRAAVRHGTVVAVATLDAHGPLPAPLIDAAWRNRPRLLDPCMAEMPPHAIRVVRLPMLLEIDGKGVPRRVEVQLGAGADFGLSSAWRAFATCVERRVLAGLRTAVPGNRRRTSVRIELVVAIDARP